MFSRRVASALVCVVFTARICLASGILAWNYPGFCLVVKDELARNEVRVDSCESYKSWDNWDIREDGSIHMGNFCLDISGAKFTNGTQLQLYQCLGNSAQTWNVGDGDDMYVFELVSLGIHPSLTVQRSISTKDGKYCIDVQWSGVPGNAVIWECQTSDVSQIWSVH